MARAHGGEGAGSSGALRRNVCRSIPCHGVVGRNDVLTARGGFRDGREDRGRTDDTQHGVCGGPVVDIRQRDRAELAGVRARARRDTARRDDGHRACGGQRTVRGAAQARGTAGQRAAAAVCDSLRGRAVERRVRRRVCRADPAGRCALLRDGEESAHRRRGVVRGRERGLRREHNSRHHVRSSRRHPREGVRARAGRALGVAPRSAAQRGDDGLLLHVLARVRVHASRRMDNEPLHSAEAGGARVDGSGGRRGRGSALRSRWLLPRSSGSAR